MIEHLIVSTIVLAAAMLLVRIVPLTARTRHAVLLCGLAKFALPASVFPTVGIRTIPVVPDALRILDGTAGIAAANTRSTGWLVVLWASVAALLFARWLLLRTRTVAAALRTASPASPRELAHLESVRGHSGIRTAVDVVRSPVCEAPAVLRVVRPVIVLPGASSEDLTDDELRGLFLHELAHVARRDNLVALFTSAAGALLWFNPLVWIALRQLAAAREQACDERVSESSDTEAYLDALTKVCRIAAAPPAAGISCMAGANVKERMEHLMRYETLRSRAWSHRGVVAVTLAAIVATALFAGEAPLKNQNLYSLKFTITPGERDAVFDVDVVDNATGEIVTSPRLRTMLTVPGTVTGEFKGREVAVRMRMGLDHRAELLLTVKEKGVVVQRTLYTWQSGAPDAEFSGAPISINLQDADVRDVMRTFAQITGMEITVAPEITGTITMNVKDMPWDEALLQAVRQVRARALVDGKTIRVVP